MLRQCSTFWLALQDKDFSEVCLLFNTCEVNAFLSHKSQDFVEHDDNYHKGWAYVSISHGRKYGDTDKWLDIAQGRAHIYKDYHTRPLAQTSASF